MAVSLLEGPQAEAVIADKGYDSAEIIASIEDLGAVAVIPPRRHRKQPRSYDRELYKQRNQIERCLTASNNSAASAHDPAVHLTPFAP